MCVCVDTQTLMDKFILECGCFPCQYHGSWNYTHIKLKCTLNKRIMNEDSNDTYKLVHST